MFSLKFFSPQTPSSAVFPLPLLPQNQIERDIGFMGDSQHGDPFKLSICEVSLKCFLCYWIFPTN